MKKLPHNIMFRYQQDKSLKIKYLMIEPTNVCNLNCRFCSRSFKKQKPKHLSLKELKKITPYFDNIKFIKLQGLGECFFAPELPQLAAHLKKCWPKVIIMTSTNLNWKKTDKELREILKNIDILYLSIDSVQKKTYEKIRRGGNFELAIKNLEKLCRLKYRHNIFTLSLIVSDLNFHDIDATVELAKRYDLDEVRINPVQDWTTNNRLTTKNNYSKPEYIKELKHWQKSRLKRPQVTVVGDLDFDYTKCIWPFERMYIDVYGNVFICCLNLDDQWIQGDIFKTPPEQIYHTKTFQSIRKHLKRNKPHPHCKNCSYKLLVPSLKKIKQK